jgi:hypothetical protein
VGDAHRRPVRAGRRCRGGRHIWCYHDINTIGGSTGWDVCAFCGKSLLPEVEVREGEKVFHLDCYRYRLYKRRRALPRLSQQS